MLEADYEEQTGWFMPSGSPDLIESASAWRASGVSGGGPGDIEGGEAGEAGEEVVLGLRDLLKRPHRNKAMMAEGQKDQDLTIQTELI